MKCIKFEENGKYVVRRCADDVARELVRDGRAEFAPKSEWKESGREYMKGVK